MIVAVGAVECIAYRARITHGNPDNIMLIDRCVVIAHEKLTELQDRVGKMIKEATPGQEA